MKYYPVNLDIRDRNCLVVGGGSVGTRKVDTLLRCGALVTVVSPKVSEDLARQAQSGAITLKQRPYESADLTGKFLVVGATNDTSLNKKIHADAERRLMLCNIADRPESCNFILPAIVQRGDLVVTASTSGKSPAYAKALKKCLEKQFTDAHATFLVLMGEIRKKLLSESHVHEEHKPIFEQLIACDLVQLIQDGRIDAIDERLFSILGVGYNYVALIETAARDAS